MIQLPERFADIRPYYDSEIPAAMQRLAADPLLEPALKFLGKEDVADDIRNLLRSITTVDQLQKQLMLPVCKELVDRTVSAFSYDGAENAFLSGGQLFVSNHRDIVMDAFLQQLVLYEHDIPTSHITFGSNLMRPQFVVDAGLSNKMFRTVRKTDDFDSFLDSSIHLSDYINYVVSHGESLWIAQRNGRTKDGLDRTEPGLVRMLLLGSRKRSTLEQLRITPVAVSYQWEPCDILKAVELYKSSGGKHYVKAPDEDLHSIITGIVSPKGNVHVSICQPLDVSAYPETIGRSALNDIVARMDAEIYAGYRLWDTNYAAYDILNGCSRFEGMYSPSLKEQFECKMAKDIESCTGLDGEALRKLYLQIYAGPVNNCL